MHMRSDPRVSAQVCIAWIHCILTCSILHLSTQSASSHGKALCCIMLPGQRCTDILPASRVLPAHQSLIPPAPRRYQRCIALLEGRAQCRHALRQEPRPRWQTWAPAHPGTQAAPQGTLAWTPRRLPSPLLRHRRCSASALLDRLPRPPQCGDLQTSLPVATPTLRLLLRDAVSRLQGTTWARPSYLLHALAARPNLAH